MAGSAVPAVFDQPGAAFVFLRPGIKFPPIEKSWEKNGHGFQEATTYATKGGNVGVMAGNGHIGLDQDDPTAFEGLDLPATTVWETRPERLGMRFTCKDRSPEVLAKYGKKADQAQIKLFKEGKPVGEVKLERTYQIIPPSWKGIDGQRVNYRMLEDVPPAEISLDWLLSELQRLGITFSSKRESNTEKLEEIVKKSRQKRAESDESRTRRYAEAALRDEVRALEGTPEGNRNEQLNRSAFALGQFVSAQVLDESEVIRELTRAARATGLNPDEIERTIRSGLESGSRHPREIPEKHQRPVSNGKNETRPEVLDEIHAKALEILQHGDPIKYITQSSGRMVLGAEKGFQKLICCVAVQGIRQSAGLHPKLNGESGAGKTWVVLTFAHHLPPEAVVKGSASNLAAFYHSDGDQVFRVLDDYQAGNETLDTIIKQTSSVFHQRYDHRSVKKQEPITLQIGSEQTWAITSVDGVQDVQVLNRQIPINVDDSEDLTRKVNSRTIRRYGIGEEQFPEDETVQVCREIWRILRADGMIDVRVPFWERIEWLDVSNRRNPSIFMDLLIAYTAMNRYQREKDADGYYLAAEDDFQSAKALFTDKDAQELVKRLTHKEREFADLLSKHPGGLTREEAADALKITGNRVSQLANGEKGKGGLTQKLPGFSIVDITDSIRIDEDHHRAIKKVVYKLSRYDPLTGFEAVVRLLPKTDNDKGGKPFKEPVRNPVRNVESKEIDNGERENREIEIGSKDSKEKVREGPEDPGEQEIFSLSLRNEEKSLLHQESIAEGAKGILTGSSPDPYRTYTKADDSERNSLHQLKPKDPAEVDPSSEKIKVTALMEFGINGSVDPIKVASFLKIPVGEVVAWLDANYSRLERPGGVVRYTQRRAEA